MIQWNEASNRFELTARDVGRADDDLDAGRGIADCGLDCRVVVVRVPEADAAQLEEAGSSLGRGNRILLSAPLASLLFSLPPFGRPAGPLRPIAGDNVFVAIYLGDERRHVVGNGNDPRVQQDSGRAEQEVLAAVDAC